MRVNPLCVCVDLNQVVFDNPGFTFHAWTLLRQSCSIPKPYQRSVNNGFFPPVFIYMHLCGTWLMGNHTFTKIMTHCLLHCLQNWCRHRIFLLYYYFVITIYML